MSSSRSSAGDAWRAVEEYCSSETPPPPPPPSSARLKCPRCDSTNTKFCYYNNYSLSQPRHFCRACRRYWTRGGTLRNVPVGGGCRKNDKRGHRIKQPPAAVATDQLLQVINDPPILLPPPRGSTSFPALPPSAAVVDDDSGASPSSMLCSLPAFASAFHGGPASCTGAAFVDLRHPAAISGGAGVDDPVLQQLHDECRRLCAGGELLEHLPQQLANDDISALVIQPKKSEEYGGGGEAAARLLLDQQMMIMMNSAGTEWQIAADHDNFSSSSVHINNLSSSFAYLKDASSSMICWPDAAAANYRWTSATATTMAAAHRI